MRSIKTANQLRIIGGTWRGRKLRFPDVPGLRPSPDRVRETLFNWLAPLISGARCLDLFAGSGALGLEAASRGAAEVVMVEQERAVVNALHKHIETLGASGVQVWEGDALVYLQQSTAPWNMVLLDPPFGSDLLQQCIQLLDTGTCLAPAAHIYLEAERGVKPALPDGWELLRSKNAGNVGFHLACVPDGR